MKSNAMLAFRPSRPAQPWWAMTAQHIVSWRLLFLPGFVIAGLLLWVMQAPLLLLFTLLWFLAYLLWLVFG